MSLIINIVGGTGTARLQLSQGQTQLWQQLLPAIDKNLGWHASHNFFSQCLEPCHPPKAPCLARLLPFHRVPDAADALEVVLREGGIVVDQQRRTLEALKLWVQQALYEEHCATVISS